MCDIQRHTLTAVRHSQHTLLHDAYTTHNKAPPHTLPLPLATLTRPPPAHGSHLSVTHTYLACTTLYTYATTHMSQNQNSLATTSHTMLAITTRTYRTRAGNSNSPMSKESTPKKKKSKSAAKAAKDMRSKLGSLVREEEPSSEEEDYSPPVQLTAADEQQLPYPRSTPSVTHRRRQGNRALLQQKLDAKSWQPNPYAHQSSIHPLHQHHQKRKQQQLTTAVAVSTSSGPWRLGTNKASGIDQIPEAVDASVITDESKADSPVSAQAAAVVDVAMSDTSPPGSPVHAMDTDVSIADHLTDLCDLYQSHGIDANTVWQPIIQAFADLPALQASTMAALDDLEMPDTYPTAALTPGADTLQSRMNVAITIPDTKSRLAEMSDVIKAAELICQTEQVYVELTRSEAKEALCSP